MREATWVDPTGDVYPSADSDEPLHCMACEEPIGLKAFSLGPDGAVHTDCETAPQPS